MIWLGSVFLILLLLGAPVAIAIGCSSAAYFASAGMPLQIVTQKMVSGAQSFTMLAIPFFVLAGNMMNETGITKRLIKFANVLTGHMLGGLAQVSVVLSALMGGISGSATSDAAMECRILGPDMLRKGYGRGFITGILSMGGMITATIPPSIPLVMYGVTGEVSIGRLFMGGFIPGILMTLFFMIVTHYISKRRGYVPEREKPPTFNEVIHQMKESIWALIFPLILIVGIRFGLFTASEAGAFATVYAFFVGLFIYKELTWKKVVKILKSTAVDISMIMLIILAAAPFGYATVIGRLPQMLSEAVMGFSENRLLVMLLIMLVVLICGMFMECIANILILTPIFLPIVTGLGIDPVVFGLCFITINSLGSMTPPVGVTMYTACSLMECPLGTYTREAMPYFISVILVAVICLVCPSIVTFLPNMVFGR
ncbi:MAG: TRAP transporter large permease [Clostridium sp.]|nr:TRAP transporter large permease [Clostridium sp.]